MITTRGLAAWSGVERLSQLPAVIELLRARPATPAALPYRLFVLGERVPRGAVKSLGILEELVRDDGDTIVATHAILPLGPSLLVCDRLDAPATADVACWPDDSSYHLALSLPRSVRWLDLGCGSAFAALLRPEVATTRVGLDLSARSIACARLGARLSNVAIELHAGDLADAAGTYDLVSCNAPIVAGDGPIWRATDRGFFARLWPTIRRVLAPGGTAVIHAKLAQLREIPAIGERIVVGYSPEFGIAWWRPDGEDRLRASARELTVGRPHITLADRDDDILRDA